MNVGAFLSLSQELPSLLAVLKHFSGKDSGCFWNSLRNLTRCFVSFKGVRAVLAAGFNETHRSNLAAVGILPLQFLPNQSAETLGLTGYEEFTVHLPLDLVPNQRIEVQVYITVSVGFLCG